MAERVQQMYDRLSSSEQALEDEIAADSEVDDTNLRSELKRQTQIVIKWGRVTLFAEEKWKEAQVYANYRIWPRARQRAITSLVTQGVQKPNEGRIEQEAYLDAEYICASERERELGSIYRVFQKVEAAMTEKKWMLQALNSRQIHELDRDLVEIDTLKDRVREVMAQGKRINIEGNHGSEHESGAAAG